MVKFITDQAQFDFSHLTNVKETSLWVFDTYDIYKKAYVSQTALQLLNKRKIHKKIRIILN